MKYFCKLFGHKWVTEYSGRRTCTRCKMTGMLA